MSKVSQFNQYEGYSEATYNGRTRQSDYLTLSDGKKLAYDVLLPTRKGVPAGEPLPVLFCFTTYLRAAKMVEDGQVIGADLFSLNWIARLFLRLRARLVESGHIIDIAFRERWLQRLMAHGYAVVAVERPGTGASTGVIEASSADAARAADEVLDWIAAQPWCDGNIGMFGTSMVAMAQYAAASAGNPHLKAILPCASSLDMYSAIIYPGGAYCAGFTRVMRQSTGVLEQMIVPVDSDPDGAMLARILQERGARTLGEASSAGFLQAPFRDSPSPHPLGDKLWLDMSLHTLLDRINQSDVAVYNSAGWYDLFARDGLLWHVNLTTPHRLHVRPLFHNGMGKNGRDLNYAAEAHRWFDYWLKDIDNGIMDEPPVHYYVMDAPAGTRWRTSEQWPLAGQQVTRFYLAADGRLARDEPPGDPEASDIYTVDYAATSGYYSRWHAVIEAAHYPDIRAHDEQALTYTTPPLAEDVEVTGHPVAHLWLAADAPDLDVFVYLEEVDPAGRSAYVTEGNLRASHRALHEAPYDNLGLPYHRSHESDVAPIPAGEPVELVFDLLPTAKVFRQGHRIRVAITCADADNYQTPVLDPPPTVRLLRDVTHVSFVELPIMAG